MPKIVVKFGGSNLKCKEDVTRVVQVVKNYGQPLVIVVSAFYGVTNFLIDALEKARYDELVADSCTKYLYDLKHESISRLIRDENLQCTTLQEVNVTLGELKKYLHGIALTGDASLALEDHVQAFGEKLSAIVLNGILKDEGLTSKVVFPEQFGLPNLKDMIGFGGSPRASINLALAARSFAFIKRRGYVIPEDIRAVCHDVLRHRIGLTYEAEANNISDSII